jgi:hypothetical protein
MPTGRNEAIAPISEAVVVAFNGNWRVRFQIIWTFQFGGAREVHVQHDNHGRRLRKFEAELATNADSHEISGPALQQPEAGWVHQRFWMMLGQCDQVSFSTLKSIKSIRR